MQNPHCVPFTSPSMPTKVAARLRDFGVEGDVSRNEIMMEDDCWNEKNSPPWTPEGLAVKIANAGKYASRCIASETPKSQFADEPDSGPVTKRELSQIEQMNQHHALVAVGASHVIIEERIDNKGRIAVERYGETTFHRMKVAETYKDEQGNQLYVSKD
jgi:hypothetical protein